MTTFFIFAAIIAAFFIGNILGMQHSVAILSKRLDELDYEDIALIRRVFLHYKLPIELVTTNSFKKAIDK